MCVGAPGQIRSIEGTIAQVDFFGVCRAVGLDLVDEPVEVGDYVLVHVGFAIHRIPAEEIEATLALFVSLAEGEP